MSQKTESNESEIRGCIKSHLLTLRLKKIHEILDDELERAYQEGRAMSEVFLRLLEAEAVAFLERRIERRIDGSKLPQRKLLEDFDFDFQPGLDKSLVMELGTMNFVPRKQGIILAGKSGTGKSHIAKALALRGCKQGYRVFYTTATSMLSKLYASLADNSLGERLKDYIRPQLLVIDELGFDRLEQEDARNAALFFKVVEGRYCKASTVLTTNIDFESLGHYLGDPIVTTSIVDRLIHHAIVISIDGPSYRLRESKALNQQKRSETPPAPQPQ